MASTTRSTLAFAFASLVVATWNDARVVDATRSRRELDEDPRYRLLDGLDGLGGGIDGVGDVDDRYDRYDRYDQYFLRVDPDATYASAIAAIEPLGCVATSMGNDNTLVVVCGERAVRELADRNDDDDDETATFEFVRPWDARDKSRDDPEWNLTEGLARVTVEMALPPPSWTNDGEDGEDAFSREVAPCSPRFASCARVCEACRMPAVACEAKSGMNILYSKTRRHQYKHNSVRRWSAPAFSDNCFIRRPCRAQVEGRCLRVHVGRLIP